MLRFISFDKKAFHFQHNTYFTEGSILFDNLNESNRAKKQNKTVSQITMAQIRPTTWPELEQNISRLGYRFPAPIKQQLAAVRAIFTQGNLVPYIAKIPNSPPLILVKGPLFGPTDPAVPRGAPMVEFVVTLPQEFPNSYPIITIELPPQGNVIKNHPNVNTEGCVFLRSIAGWNPRTSQLDQCLKDLYVAFKNDFPFVPVSQREAAMASNSGASNNALVSQQQTMMPSQTLQMGARISSALASTVIAPVVVGAVAGQIAAKKEESRRADEFEKMRDEQLRQQEVQRQQQAQAAAAAQQQAMQRTIPPPLQPPQPHQLQQPFVVQQRPANVQPAYATSQQYDFSKGDFEGMLCGAPKPPGTTIATPEGFGLPGLIAAPVNMPMQVNGPAPMPLPPVTDPTPDEQYRIAVATAEREREREAQTSSGFGGFLKSVKGAATSAKNAVEDKVREQVRSNDVERFNKLFPTMRHENFLTTYVCSTLVGNGTMRKGHVFVTSVGVHFTTKPTTDPKPEDLPRPPEFTCSLPLRGIVSIALGQESGRRWIHLICIDGTVRSFTEIAPGWTATTVASFASAALNDTPHDRFYNWLDHAWRACTPVPHPSYPYAGSQLQRSAPALLPPVATPTQQQQTSSASDDSLCCVCLEKPKNCFFRPCGHVACCMGCSAQLKTCPICRTSVTESFQAFL